MEKGRDNHIHHMNISFWQKKGFTLVEILLVVAIIGILASIVLISLGPIQRQGRDARRLSDLRSIQSALELYYNKCGYYPGAAAPTLPCPAWVNPASWGDMATALTGSSLGINQIPNDPTSGRTYGYLASGNGSSYILAAQLEDVNNPALSQSASAGTAVGSVGTCGTSGVYCIQF